MKFKEDDNIIDFKECDDDIRRHRLMALIVIIGNLIMAVGWCLSRDWLYGAAATFWASVGWLLWDHAAVEQRTRDKMRRLGVALREHVQP